MLNAFNQGADLSHVICSPTAASAIKSYAPDLIVHPILREDSSPEKLKPELDSLFSRLHAIVIGPGLGREPYMQAYARLALSIARERGMYIVLDADGRLLVFALMTNGSDAGAARPALDAVAAALRACGCQ